jgi:TMPIT-like protein
VLFCLIFWHVSIAALPLSAFSLQMGRMYAMRAMGTATAMDVMTSDTLDVPYLARMYFIIPFVVMGQILQLYSGCELDTVWVCGMALVKGSVCVLVDVKGR